MIAGIINLIYPSFCQICGRKTSVWNHNLCKGCLKKIKKRLPPFCTKCGKQLSREPCLCGDCKDAAIYFDRALSVFYYDSLLKKLMHDLKYRKITSLIKEFVEAILGFIKEHNVGKKADIVLSIPMHPLRLFKREINASHLLAKDIAKKLDLPYSGNLLKKIKNTRPQSKLTRSERIKNIRGSFSVQKNGIPYVKNKNILLADDIFTTGSTTNECARILKNEGANSVEIITIARGDNPA